MILSRKTCRVQVGSGRLSAWVVQSRPRGSQRSPSVWRKLFGVGLQSLPGGVGRCATRTDTAPSATPGGKKPRLGGGGGAAIEPDSYAPLYPSNEPRRAASNWVGLCGPADLPWGKTTAVEEWRLRGGQVSTRSLFPVNCWLKQPLDSVTLRSVNKRRFRGPYKVGLRNVCI